MLAMHTERVVTLIPTSRRRPAPTAEQRVVYALARLRVADMREPPARLAHLARSHD